MRKQASGGRKPPGEIGRAQWLVLVAAFLGWMFDGLEMGLFPLVARPALRDLLQVTDDGKIGLWFGVITAGFLVGAATGGVLFGWLGDRLGRVRAMMLSVLTYAVFSGLCGIARTAEEVAAYRFIAALGMGGEWSLGVALVMEVWPDRSRGVMAGLIGAASNVGFMLIAVIGLGLGMVIDTLADVLSVVGLPQPWNDELLANSAWRLLMIVGAAPALLTLFIRWFVPESERWRYEQKQGATSHWAAGDLLGVAVGAAGASLIIYLWVAELSVGVRVVGTVLGLGVATLGYLFPLIRYLQRIGAADVAASIAREAPLTLPSPAEGERGLMNAATAWTSTVGRMLLGACLGGVALIGTWGASQWTPLWADQLAGDKIPEAKALTQICSAIGAIVGTMLGALAGDWFGRRITYSVLCVGSLASAMLLYQVNHQFGPNFLASVFIVGMFTASFYGWLPLYLPELFRTRVRATAQGFSFNFGRILAAIGVLQTGNLMGIFEGSYPRACSVVSLIYAVGLGLIWLAPETKGRPLPE